MDINLLKSNISVILILLFIFPSYSQSDAPIQNISQYFNYVPLGQALDTLINKYHFKIQYSKEDLAPYRLTYLFTDTRPEIVIRICLDNTDLSYKLDDKNKYIIFNPKKQLEQKKKTEETAYNGKPTRKDFSIKGMIKDVASGESLPFVNISIIGSNIGTSSNVDGYFSLIDVPNDTVGLKLDYIGYQSKLFYLRPKMDFTNLVLEMEPQSFTLDEVVVGADREELLRANEKTSMIKISPSKISALPSIGEKDVMRSFQLMPGVSAANENSSGLYVRGGTPDQTLVLYDGFNVYHVEHLFGFFSAFNPNAIKDVQLYKGGFESKFGGRISSVAEITGKDGNSKQTNLGINLGLIAANATLEVPVGDKITTLFAYRRSYQSGLYKKIFDKINNNTAASMVQIPSGFGGGFGRGFRTTTTPSSFFYDMNAKVTYKPSQNDIVTLSLYNGTDNMDNSRSGAGRINFQGGGGGTRFASDINDVSDWGNTGGSLKWSHRFSKSLYINSLISGSHYFSVRDRRSDFPMIDSIGVETTTKVGTLEDNNLIDYSGKVDLEYQINKHHEIELGLGTTYNKVDYVYSQNDTAKFIDRHNTGSTNYLYLQDKMQIGKLSMVPGLRVDNFTPTKQVYYQPRFSLNYDLSDKIKIKGAYGHYYQFIKRVVREDVLQGSRDFWVLADDDRIPIAKSIHYIAGLSYDMKNWLVDMELYQKDIIGLSEYSLRINPSPRSLSYAEKFAQGSGIAKGIDLLIQKKYGKLNGWVSYSLGSVKYNFADFGKPFYANQDVRNEFKIVSIYNLKNWDFSATMIYATGRPYTSPTGGYELTLLNGTTQSFITTTDKNGVRLPAYNRMDIAVSYKWQSIKGAPRTLSFSIFNLYARKNTWYKEFEINAGQILETDVNFLGFTPNISLSWQLH
ncbi:MAG: carboxypeptidase-like regulatory domain-containing protein [Saprospiraceae bacterium]